MMIPKAQSAQPKWTELEPASSIVVPGSARGNRTGDWRSSRPVWDHAKCIKCGMCVVYCPEGCVVWRADGLPEADLEYCKGCGICRRECWTSCIRDVEEEA